MSLQPITSDLLRQELVAASRLLLVLDGGLVDDLEESVRKQDYRAWFDWVYHDTEYARQYQRGPMLVEARADSPLLDTLIDRWVPEHAGSIVLSAQPFETVLQHLRNLRHAQLPDGSTARLRLYEPRALRGFAQGADVATGVTLLGPIDHWYWCEWNEGQGDWYRLDHPWPGQGRAADGPLIAPYALSRALDAHRTEYRNRGYFRRLRMAGIPSVDATDDALLWAAVQQHAADAQSRGFDSDEDIEGFLDVYFRYHDALFTPDSPLALALADTRLPAWRRLQNAHALMRDTTA